MSSPYGAISDVGGDVSTGSGRCRCWKKYGGHISGAILTIIFVTAAVVAVTLLRTPNHATPETLNMESILRGDFAPITHTPVWLANGDFLFEMSEGGIRFLKRYSASTFTTTNFLNSSTLNIGNYNYGNDFFAYYPSTDAKFVLFAINRQKQFRSSFYAQWILYNVATTESRYLLEGIGGSKQFAANPSWNPALLKADSLAIVIDHNVVILSDLKNDTFIIKNVTSDGSPFVWNGMMDWLYEEEVFESSPALYWSPDGTQLAYLRLDDTLVGEVPYPWFVPLGESPYPTMKTVRYPKAGTTNPKASAHVYTLASEATSTMQLLPNTEYITSIGWIPERPGQIGVRVLPRLQQIETLLVNNASSGLTLASLVTQNMTGGWVESRPYSIVWVDANRFVDIRAHDDFYHVALMSLIEPEVVFLTSGQFAVTAIAGYEHSTSSVFFLSTEAGATTRNLYSVTLHGKVERITHQHITGTKYNSVYWGPGDIYVLEGSSADTPTKQWVVPKKTTFTTQHVLSENQWLVEKLASYNVPSKVFTTVTGANGDELNAYMIHPHGAIDGILYPVLFTFYQGPTSARVLDMWSLGFNEWISTRSKVIVVVIDGAGTAGRSISFNQQIYLRLGVKETADQLAAITGLLKKRRDMDWNRVAVWGWSYGGFMTLNLALNSNGIFNGAISVAPVTDWRLYDTFYTERYMQTPATNEAGYNETSMLRLVDTNAASRLSIEMQNRTHLYLVHGLADDNVHFQNSAEFVQRMVANDVPLSMAYYPNQDHSISRDGSLLHLYHGIRYFLKSNVIDFLFYDLHPDS